MNQEEVWNFIFFVFSIPIIFASIQLTLLLTVFRFDTPNFLVQNNEDEKLRELFSRLYTSSEEVESRMLKIK